jgi:Flp pilus assembly protein TadB
MQQSSNASSSEAPQLSATSAFADLPARSLWGVVWLVLLTVGSLAVAWLLPDVTLLHFLWVAQVLPVLYLLLVWWGTQTQPPADDAP